MCNRARLSSEPETLFQRFGASWAQDVTRPNEDPVELFPKSKAFIVREESGRRAVDLMLWDVLGGGAAWPMTNVRNLGFQNVTSAHRSEPCVYNVRSARRTGAVSLRRSLASIIAVCRIGRPSPRLTEPSDHAPGWRNCRVISWNEVAIV